MGFSKLGLASTFGSPIMMGKVLTRGLRIRKWAFPDLEGTYK